jgi:hypothetical protein
LESEIQETYEELPTSFINTLKSSTPANRPLDSLDVVNSIEPIVCLRLRATISVIFMAVEGGIATLEEIEAISDMILLSRLTARERAEAYPDRKSSIFLFLL